MAAPGAGLRLLASVQPCVFDRLTLEEDLRDVHGRTLGVCGLVISTESIADAAQRAPRARRRSIGDTFAEAELLGRLADPTYEHLFEGDGVRAGVSTVLRSIELPDALWDELGALRAGVAEQWDHALVTAAIAVRMLLAAVGPARGVPELAAAALLHDLGMTHLALRLRRGGGPLSRADAAEITHHPLLGAYHLASVLGPHPAVAAAQTHHWRCGQGYPALPASPPRSILVVGVASAFAALTRPRPFRSGAFDARGAADVLIDDVAAGHADGNTVKLLVHALRGGRGDVRQVRFGHARLGHSPEVNRHAPLAPPDRSPV